MRSQDFRTDDQRLIPARAVERGVGRGQPHANGARQDAERVLAVPLPRGYIIHRAMAADRIMACWANDAT
jgi:hypothetical protein